MSLSATRPLEDTLTSSPSNSSIAVTLTREQLAHMLYSYFKSICVCSATISPSNSAGPTPTIMIDMGRDAACRQYLINALLKRSLSFQNIVKVSKQKGLTVTTASLVCTMSEITPSVMISSTKYWEPSVTSDAHLGIYRVKHLYI